MPDSGSEVLDERVRLLEERLLRAEDVLEIGRLIASYGPAADSGDVEKTAAIWADDGRYEVPGFDIPPGRQGVADLLTADFHQALIAHGSAHLLSPHVIQVDGDRATATGYAFVVVPVTADTAKDGFRVLRSVATRWELQRHEQGWECVRRVNGLLDGRSVSRELLGGAGG
jgi:ketosteroid isomerase-like protein